ncbi:hypothetical protein GCM10018980_53680 [Streptomyces capoamus]|uniref:Uncharacterized protein n=1 Tax=Streptomyces capoamus TaxID=68183 RepID=A0A919KDR8_9ACTN|nr:hypothetical protein GCM10010501_42230 [Streptomyces libani subsp. rufus]GHG63265.1 hypothetical protein GCM10018980_53680 [Streptomyces capoamus]
MIPGKSPVTPLREGGPAGGQARPRGAGPGGWAPSGGLGPQGLPYSSSLVRTGVERPGSGSSAISARTSRTSPMNRS